MSEHRQTGRAAEWARGHPFFSAMLVFALIASVGFARTQQIADQTADASQQQSADNAARIAEENAIVRALRGQLRCTKATLAASAERTKNLTPKANKRLNDLFAAFDAAIAGHSEKARRIYRRASRENRAYLRYVAHHPVPSLQRACRTPNLPPPQRPPRRSPSPSEPHPTPTATITRTMTVPGPQVTRTVTGPTVTRTVYAPPGKARTVAVTRTITATVTTTANPICSVAPDLPTC